MWYQIIAVESDEEDNFMFPVKLELCWKYNF